MAVGRMRSTRRLRAWIVEQVSSGKYPGLVWDDEAKTMFRIPWKHAGKQDFRKDEDAAIFKAWAEFKGKLTEEGRNNPASWKTRLRCALNKSPEFTEVNERAQLDISEPYKVYRLVPFSEQGLVMPEKKSREGRSRRSKRRSSEAGSDDVGPSKRIKTEDEVAAQQLVKPSEPSDSECVEEPQLRGADQIQAGELVQLDIAVPREVLDELMLDVRIEESVVPTPPGDQDSLNVAIHYLGEEVLQRQIQGTDVRITYEPSSMIPPTALKGRFPRILLPEPSPALPAGEELRALHHLLPFMESGVVLTSSPQGVYGRRFCRGRVFWRGPHTTAPGLHKMERNTPPVLLFSKDVFRRQLEDFRSNGGEPPQCGLTLCFGEELSNTEDPSRKLIIVQVTFPWAEQQVRSAQSLLESITILQSLASQSPLGEITLNLVAVAPSSPEEGGASENS